MCQCQNSFMFFQVCHHPPISACHADSENFSFWQGDTVFFFSSNSGDTSESRSILNKLCSHRPEVEKQILGEVAGDSADGNGERHSSEVNSPHLRRYWLK